MYGLSNLTDVEIETYVSESFGHTDEFKQISKKNELIKNLKTLSKEIKSLDKDIALMKDIIQVEDYDKIEVVGKGAVRKAKHCLYSTRKILTEVGYSEDLYAEYNDEMQITGTNKDGILHIILPELLPDKVAQGEGSRYDEITRLYLPAFRNFFSKGRFPIYESKAVLCFFNYYTSEQELKDHDNFETKQIIDILSTFILPDDNPKWCSHFMDYRFGDKCHTEIYVIPQSKFIEMWNKI